MVETALPNSEQTKEIHRLGGTKEKSQRTISPTQLLYSEDE